MTEQGGGKAWKQTIYYPFMLTSRYGRGTVLQPVVNCTKHDTAAHEDVTDVETVAVRNEEKEELNFFAVNRSTCEAGFVTSVLKGASWNLIRLKKQ